MKNIVLPIVLKSARSFTPNAMAFVKLNGVAAEARQALERQALTRLEMRHCHNRLPIT